MNILKHQCSCGKKDVLGMKIVHDSYGAALNSLEGRGKTLLPHVDPGEVRKRAMRLFASFRAAEEYFILVGGIRTESFVNQTGDEFYWPPASSRQTRGLSQPLGIAATSISPLHQEGGERMPNRVVCLLPSPPGDYYAI